MTLARIETVRDLCSQGRWNAAVGILVEADAAVVADFMMTLPFEEQRALFRAMPVAFAASLIGCFTYFHAYVLSALASRAGDAFDRGRDESGGSRSFSRRAA